MKMVRNDLDSHHPGDLKKNLGHPANGQHKLYSYKYIQVHCTNYDGRSINKLKNDVILLVFKI